MFGWFFFFFLIFAFFAPGACQRPAPNIINIIKREGEEREGGFDKGGQAPSANIIDNYFEREEEREGEVERKGIINICVYDLLIIYGIYFILGYLFAPLFGVYLQTVIGLIQAPDGIIGYIFAPIIGAFATHNKGLIGIATRAPGGAYTTTFEDIAERLHKEIKALPPDSMTIKTIAP